MNQASIAEYVEVCLEEHKGFLDPLVPHQVHHADHLVAEIIDVGNVEALVVDEEAIARSPRGTKVPSMSYCRRSRATRSVTMAWRMVLKCSKDSPERAHAATTSSSRWDNTSTVELSWPRRYSMVKSNLNNLLSHWC